MTYQGTDARHALYTRFARRNRVIDVLRVVVPIAGVLLALVPVAQVVIASIATSLPIQGIRLENDTLVIDAPRFEGRTATGTVYAMQAARAETRVGDLDIADLYDLEIALTDEGDYAARIGFSSAQWTMSTETLVSNEDVAIADSTGAEGILGGVHVDWPGQLITSEGPVHFTFASGADLVADTMVHDLDTARWHFSGVRLDMVPQADAGESRDPFTQEPTP